MANVTRITRKARADLFMYAYIALGPDRSFKALREHCIALGLKRPPAISTIAGWSTDFGWAEQAREYDEKHGLGDGTPTDLWKRLNEMDASQMVDARTMVVWGLDWLRENQKLVTASVAVRMVVDGIKLERLAAGKTTARIEFTVQQMGALVVVMVGQFTLATERLRGHVPDELLEEVRDKFAQAIDDEAQRLLLDAGIDVRLEDMGGDDE